MRASSSITELLHSRRRSTSNKTTPPEAKQQGKACRLQIHSTSHQTHQKSTSCEDHRLLLSRRRCPCPSCPCCPYPSCPCPSCPCPYRAHPLQGGRVLH